MTRREQIETAASELYKESEFRVPNMFCFIEGAEWADKNPPDRWLSFKERKPDKGQYIILRIDHEDMRMASLEIVRFDPIVFPSEVGENAKWFPVTGILTHIIYMYMRGVDGERSRLAVFGRGLWEAMPASPWSGVPSG